VWVSAARARTCVCVCECVCVCVRGCVWTKLRGFLVEPRSQRAEKDESRLLPTHHAFYRHGVDDRHGAASNLNQPINR
jgi:hypothetical protein